MRLILILFLYLFTINSIIFCKNNIPSAFNKNVIDSSKLLSEQSGSPQIQVFGNGVKISNGDDSPGTNDNTSFGDIYVSGRIYKFFEIRNTGDADLILKDSKLIITGNNADDFSLLNMDYISPIIKPGNSIGVRIDFTPKASGLRNAEIVIENNDPNNLFFTFSIQGKGLEPFTDPSGTFNDINVSLQGVGSDGSYIGRSSTDWGDYDNDGDLDFVITGFSNNGFKTKIYKNEGNNSFVDIDAQLQQVGRGCAKWGDYDNDNDLDLIVTGLATGEGGIHQGIATIYRNDGNDVFTKAASLNGVTFSSVSWGDYDNDGDLDIVIGGSSYGASTVIYRNDGNSVFTPITANIAGIDNGEILWGDYNNDGYLDLVVAGAHKYGEANYITNIYKNNGNGTFTDINANIAVSGSSAAWGDYDNDGDLDLAVAGVDISYKYISKIFRNDGNNIFSDINAPLTGVTNGSIKFGDYDNDGDLDLIISGSISPGVSGVNAVTTIYENKGNNVFIKKTDLIGVLNSSISWGDYDSDGDLDLISTGDVQNYQITKIYNNSTLTANTRPEPPANLNVEIDGKNALLKWDKAEDKESSQNSLTYNIYVGTSPMSGDIVSPLSNLSSGKRKITSIGNTSHNNSWRINNLSYGKTYYWSVQSIDNSFEGSSFSPEQSFYTGISLYQPTGLTAASGNQKAILQWPKDQNTDISKYYIYRSISGGSPVKIDSITGNSNFVYVARNLTNNITYYFCISAVDFNNDESMLSNPVYIEPHKVPSLIFSANYLDYHDTGIGDSLKLTLLGINKTIDSLSITGFSLNSTSFFVTGKSCKLMLNDSILIPVWFKPDKPGYCSGILKIFTEEDTLSVPMTGFSPYPNLSCDKSKIEFLYTPKDSVRSFELKISNMSISRLDIDTIFTATKYFSSEFSKTAILPNSSISLKVKFSPDSLGSFTDTLKLRNNSQISIVKIPLTGNSKLTETKLSNSFFDFDTVAQYSERIMVLTIRNLSLNILEISSIKHHPDYFQIDYPMPLYVTGNDSLHLYIKFHPTLPGSFVDTAKVITNGGNSLIVLKGFCAFPNIIVNADSLNFGSIKINTVAQKQIDISNPSITMLEIDSVKSVTPYFKSTGLQTPVFISRYQPVILTIKFSPIVIGDFYDTLSIFHTSLNSPVKIFLFGKGEPLTDANDNSNKLPDKYSLSQNYPNPFNPVTTISYSIPKTSFVVIKIFNVLGKEIKTLVNEEKLIGNYKVEFDATNLTSGIYFYRIQADNFSDTKKVILLK